MSELIAEIAFQSRNVPLLIGVLAALVCLYVAVVVTQR
jgi:hypothetical protein